MSSVIDPDQMPQNDTGSAHNLPLPNEFFDKLIGNKLDLLKFYDKFGRQ